MMTVSPASVTSARAIAEISRLGFRYWEDQQYPLAECSPERRVQIRESEHYAPPESVERYAVQMSQSEFPPVVMTKDHWIVDGNTRIGARLLRKEKACPAIVLDVAWEGAGRKTQGMLFALAATLNSQNGVPLTAQETRAAVRTFLELGWLNEQIGRAIGVKASTVTQVRKQIEAEAKLAKVGLGTGISPASLRALGAKDVLALNDEPYRKLAELAADADLGAREIGVLARETRETGSDEAGLKKVAEAREEMQDRITAKQLTGRASPPASAQLRRFLGNATKYEGREEELLELDPALNDKHLEVLNRSLRVLTRVRDMQAGAAS